MDKAGKNLTHDHENEKRECRGVESEQSTLHPSSSTPNLDDDWIVFVPSKEIRVIEDIFNKMEQARETFCKMAEEWKSN